MTAKVKYGSNLPEKPQRAFEYFSAQEMVDLGFRFFPETAEEIEQIAIKERWRERSLASGVCKFGRQRANGEWEYHKICLIWQSSLNCEERLSMEDFGKFLAVSI